MSAQASARPRAWVELLLVAVVVALFGRLQGLTARDVPTATAHALAVQRLEQPWHVDVELAANQWLLAHEGLAVAATVVYRLHFVAILAVLVWVYLRRPEVYRRVRRVLVTITVLALVVYASYPLSPPRFSLPGSVDVIALHDPFHALAAHPATIEAAGSLHAMPSMHTAWSAWCAYAAWAALRSSGSRLAPLPWLYPVAMVGIVLGTGAHYVLDLVGSAVLLTVGIVAARVLDRVPVRFGGLPSGR